jgi:hypothetical protein
MTLAIGAGPGAKLGTEARASPSSGAEARPQSLLRIGIKTLMNDPIATELHLSAKTTLSALQSARRGSTVTSRKRSELLRGCSITPRLDTGARSC